VSAARRLQRVALAACLAASASGYADDESYGGASVIYVRATALYKADPRGRGEIELAKLSDKTTVRALRTDAAGKVLLVDLGGTWSWLPLDGTTTKLAPLPCLDGPAQLAEDTSCVVCRAQKGSVIVHLPTGQVTAIDVPSGGTRISGVAGAHRLVWADAKGVWAAPPGQPARATKVAPEPPVRGFLPSPDGTRALGVYPDEVFTDAHHKKTADVLMGFQLDGLGARRKAIGSGVPVEWSHDSQWVLVQDGASACIMRASGGEYKCWRGYTAASIAPDGKFALVLGNRDHSKKQTPAKPRAAAEPEAEGEDAEVPADVYVAPPSGPLALYRVKLEGSPYAESPALVAKNVDGAAVWVPGTAP
jgi:hypothetical protein